MRLSGVENNNMAQQQRSYEGSRVYAVHIEQVVDCFEDFAHSQLHRWRLVNTAADPRGRELRAVFELSFTQRVRVNPVSLMANINEGREAYDRFKRGIIQTRTIERVPYQYTTTFRFYAVTSSETRVTFETLEEIDPYLQVERNLNKHFAAPPMPNGRGNIGEEFLQFADRGVLVGGARVAF